MGSLRSQMGRFAPDWLSAQGCTVYIDGSRNFLFVFLYFSFACPPVSRDKRQKRTKENTASCFLRPTYSSIPKPVKPFGLYVFGKNHGSLRPLFSDWLLTESSLSGCPAENPKAVFSALRADVPQKECRKDAGRRTN